MRAKNLIWQFWRVVIAVIVASLWNEVNVVAQPRRVDVAAVALKRVGVEKSDKQSFS